ncbi:MAG TPA: hypothetical protein IGS37_03665 [Synechococcales cyanobacterium M55_K2018_004]|nr:hypothetical protein [Synechococcales cyanobacterium M55_K2018_004]
MSHDHSFDNLRVPAPCIVDTGILVNKQDMHRLLCDLGRVRYSYFQDGKLTNEDEGFVMEVFADPVRTTIVANHALYLNVCSFDYLELKQEGGQVHFELNQENRYLRLTPLTNPLQEQSQRTLDAATLEAVVTEVLSAGWDMRFDDEEHFSS